MFPSSPLLSWPPVSVLIPTPPQTAMKLSTSAPVSIIPLPQPSTVSSKPRPLRIPWWSRPYLPDDVLLEILPYLGLSDALHLSLTSKHVHEVAPIRITTLVCKTIEMAFAMHEYFTKAEFPERVLHLRFLTIRESAIADGEVLGSGAYSAQNVIFGFSTLS